uniref:Uncharacterized protein n=1 Tax=Anopheles maculatus TaxID=74869 RepID=A0A182SEC3_9DIPT
MVQHTNQTLIRIVSVDHYMSKPDPQFDSCYSEFRGSEVRQVPVIRLFGSNSEGTHSCVHIHGVFPYFYIPYEGSIADKLALDQKIYQLACALDKGINVSLGRTSSQAKHIFKIVLVKGIPIYGYHRNPHHYFKIYLYNPFLVRNATQLLMNGTILSGTYQVHETHIPYILQFFIDYNLYGMSFLELKTDGLRQRTNDADVDSNIPPKMSTSEYEIDVLASDIMNREPEDKAKDGGEFANPGIASIWKDEQTRRLLLGLEQPERMNLSQDSGPVQEVITESDRFYRARLLAKLSKDATPSSSSENQRKQSTLAYPSEANEGDMLLDASYIQNHARPPTTGHSNESLYDSQISYQFDASTVASLNLSQANKKLNASMYGDLEAVCLMSDQAEWRPLDPDDPSFDSDDEFLLDFSQKQSGAGGSAFLTEANKFFSASGDDLLSGGLIPQLDGNDDSFKVTTSKRGRKPKKSQSPSHSSAKKIRIDLTQPLARKSLTPRRVTFALSPEEKNDERAKRALKKFEESSPNTLKPLEIRIPKLGLIKKSILFTNRNRSSPKSETATGESLKTMKNLHVRLTKLDPTAYDVSQPSSSSVNTSDRYELARKYDLANNFDPLEGPSTPKSERVRRKSSTSNEKGQPKPKMMKLDDEQQIELILSERFKNIVRLSPKVLIKPLLLNEKLAVNDELSLDAYSSPKAGDAECGEDAVEEAAEVSALSTEAEAKAAAPSTDSESSSDSVATPPQEQTVESDGMEVEFSLPTNSDHCDTDNEIIGSSKNSAKDNGTDETAPVISIADDDCDDLHMITPSLLEETAIAGMFAKNDDNLRATIDLSDDESVKNGEPAVNIGTQLDGVVELMDEGSDENQQPPVDVVESEDDNPNIQSFCERTLVCELDDINSDSDDSCLAVGPWNKEGAEEDNQPIVISLAAPAPTREDAQRAIDKFEIPAIINPTPFYSDPGDVTGRKEVGHTVLNIAGNSLNDVEEFSSTIAGLGSLKHLRYDNLQRTFGENISDVVGPIGPTGPNSDRMKELLASEGSVVISPAELPPNRTEAIAWIDNRCRQRQDVEPVVAIESDSPIKVKTAETIMALEDDGDAQPTRIPPPKIDIESSLNLSVLVGHTEATTNGTGTATHVSQTMTNSNSLNAQDDVTPSGSTNSAKDMEEVGVTSHATKPPTLEDDVELSQEQQVQLGQDNRVPSPRISALNQSDLIEHSNADISTATPIDNTFGYKVGSENLQDAKAKCEMC